MKQAGGHRDNTSVLSCSCDHRLRSCFTQAEILIIPCLLAGIQSQHTLSSLRLSHVIRIWRIMLSWLVLWLHLQALQIGTVWRVYSSDPSRLFCTESDSWVSLWQQSLSLTWWMTGPRICRCGADTNTVCFSICQIKASLRADTRLHNQKWWAAAAVEMTLNINNASEEFLALNEERVPGCASPEQAHFKEHTAWWHADTDNTCTSLLG